MEEVWSDEELDQLIDRYARGQKEPIFATLTNDLDKDTFATLFRLRRRPDDKEDRYVAVIDCRGDKGARRFFTRWHEIAHILTTVEQWELPLHRSTIEKDPLETMMDIIAADVGFYAPIFCPMLDKHISHNENLTFEIVRRIREDFCPTASFEATLYACANRLSRPVILLSVQEQLKKSELRALQEPELFPTKRPTPKLRVKFSRPNDSAKRSNFRIHPNMRVPKASIIFKTFQEGIELSEKSADENLVWWRSSDGKGLPYKDVKVEALKYGNKMWAIVTPRNR